MGRPVRGQDHLERKDERSPLSPGMEKFRLSDTCTGLIEAYGQRGNYAFLLWGEVLAALLGSFTGSLTLFGIDCTQVVALSCLFPARRNVWLRTAFSAIFCISRLHLLDGVEACKRTRLGEILVPSTSSMPFAHQGSHICQS